MKCEAMTEHKDTTTYPRTMSSLSSADATENKSQTKFRLWGLKEHIRAGVIVRNELLLLHLLLAAKNAKNLLLLDATG